MYLNCIVAVVFELRVAVCEIIVVPGNETNGELAFIMELLEIVIIIEAVQELGFVVVTRYVPDAMRDTGASGSNLT